ncbi:MAG: glycosyltransferase [Blastocatellia bacterium]
MRILHVIPGIASRYGGPSQAIYTMCCALQGQRVDLLIATTNADGEAELPVALSKTVVYQDVPTIFFARQFSEALKYSHPLAVWLDQNVCDFDVVHIHAVFSHACIAAARACRKHRIPYIVRPLGTLDPWSLKQKQFRKKVLWHFGVKQMLRRAAAIHYTTAEERRLVESGLGLLNGVVIPNGIDLAEALRCRDRDGAAGLPLAPASSRARYCNKYVLALSRIHPKKGYELLIESFGDLKRRDGFSDWQLVIAGDGEAEYVGELKSLAERNGLNGDVRFVGWLEGDRKQAALHGAALMVLPSYQENFGISLVEAMACGVPVLVSPYVNLAPEIKEAGAGWIAELNHEAFTKVLAEAMSNEQERQHRGARGRQLADSFSAEKVAAKLIHLYESLIETNHRQNN